MTIPAFLSGSACGVHDAAMPTDVGKQVPHICVCVCTYKREELLRRTLGGLACQESDGAFTFSLVVVDNDSASSAKEVVVAFAKSSGIDTTYLVEPQQNIALARNRAVAVAGGDLVAFIDDDEIPPKCWLATLFAALVTYGVGGVLGPVMPHFDTTPPTWVTKSGLWERPSYPTGTIIGWRMGRTGNVLLRREVLASEVGPFRPQFLTGEDQDFFRRLIERGHRFVWCHEAVAYEIVPPVRWKLWFLIRRALHRGAVAPLHPGFGWREILKSVVAVPAYLIAVPLVLPLGGGTTIVLLVKLCDHVGRLLSLAGIKLVKDAYVIG